MSVIDGWGRYEEGYERFRRSLTCISKLCSFKTPARSHSILSQSPKDFTHHSQASDFSNTEIEAAQIQRLLAHWRQVGDRCAPLLHEGDVAIHPCPPLRLTAHVVQSCYLLVCHVPRAELLEWMGTEESKLYHHRHTPHAYCEPIILCPKSKCYPHCSICPILTAT